MMMLRSIALVFGLLCGVASSQLPEFVQQYRQRLGGALDELTAMVAQFQSEARAAGLDSAGAIAQLEANRDQLVRDRGRSMAQTIARRDRLADQQQRMQNAGQFARLLVFAQSYDSGIARRAWGDYEPAVPTAPEGFASAGVGALLGYGFLRLVGAPFRRRRKQPATA
ncbi:MAG: DUF2937 family protein [Methylobacteriaceae bacterium]|nr:DUF2937 family protein [Methylobacteriaceae bacterium]